MVGRVVEIADTGRHLSLYRGFLVVKAEQQEQGRVPLSDISVLMLSGHGNSLSTNMVNKLLENGSMIVFCGSNFHPSGLVWPMASHHLQQKRLHDQIAVSKPLKKRLWQTLVQAKIKNQADLLETFGASDPTLQGLVQRVGSGDPENCEAQAARRYWKPLMGPEFKRDVKAEGINGLLNYGYAVLRAATARAVASTGLHPALSLHHHNQSNPFGLVDDLMEPFRPWVDGVVRRIRDEGIEEVIPKTKRQLAAVLDLDMKTDKGNTPLSNCLFRLAQSLVTSYENKKDCLVLPEGPKELQGDEDS